MRAAGGLRFGQEQDVAAASPAGALAGVVADLALPPDEARQSPLATRALPHRQDRAAVWAGEVVHDRSSSWVSRKPVSVWGVEDTLGMSYNFLACDREQVFLMAPDPRDWLGEDHFAWFVLESVERIDLSAFYASYRLDGWGRAAFEPEMMAWLRCFCTRTRGGNGPRGGSSASAQHAPPRLGRRPLRLHAHRARWGLRRRSGARSFERRWWSGEPAATERRVGSDYGGAGER
jgi:hypothetical protein